MYETETIQCVMTMWCFHMQHMRHSNSLQYTSIWCSPHCPSLSLNTISNSFRPLLHQASASDTVLTKKNGVIRNQGCNPFQVTPLFSIRTVLLVYRRVATALRLMFGVDGPLSPISLASHSRPPIVHPFSKKFLNSFYWAWAWSPSTIRPTYTAIYWSPQQSLQCPALFQTNFLNSIYCT